MRRQISRWALGLAVVILGRTLAAQAPRLPEPGTRWQGDVEARWPARPAPAPSRHAHVRDGVLIGAGIGGLAGAVIGLANDRALCPSDVIVCKTPEGKLLSLVAGLAIGGAVGGVTGGVIGAFIHTTDRPDRTAAGVAVHF